MRKEALDLIVKLYPHNEKAYKALTTMLKTEQRACIVQPPSTGKSYIAMRLIQDNPRSRFVWLSPSNYIFAEQQANFDIDGVRMPSNLETMTYAKLLSLTKSNNHLPVADFIILDEFHHCGSPEWSKGVDALIETNPDAKLVGMSATEIRYSDNERDMTSELFNGNVANRITFAQAWADGILSFPKYVCALYDSPEELEVLFTKISRIGSLSRRRALSAEYEKLRRRVAEACKVEDVLAKHISNPNAKVLVFCMNEPHLLELHSMASEWFSGVNKKMHIYKTTCAYPQGEAEYNAFKEDTSDALKVMYCINQLNEGVHIPNVDVAVMVRPTKSPVIFKQQLGRVLSAKGSEPLVIDLVNNIESAGTIKSFCDEAQGIQKAITNVSVQDSPVSFTIIDEVADVRFLMSELEAATSPDVRMMSETNRTYWEQWFDPALNPEVNPACTSSNSAKTATLRCKTCNGAWSEPVKKLVRRRRCPYCSGDMLLPGFNDYATVHANAMQFWLEAEGEDFNPHLSLANNDTRKWGCCVCKHEWDATPEQVTELGCPICQGIILLQGVNDLKTYAPAIAAEWSRQNRHMGKATPLTTTWASTEERLWTCPTCGNDWKASPHDRIVSKKTCPICSGEVVKRGVNDIGTLYPELAAEFRGIKGGKSRQARGGGSDVSPESKGDAWWLCAKCGWGFSAPVAQRVDSFELHGEICDCPCCGKHGFQTGQDQGLTIFDHAKDLKSACGELCTIGNYNKSQSNPKSTIMAIAQAHKLEVSQEENAFCLMRKGYRGKIKVRIAHYITLLDKESVGLEVSLEDTDYARFPKRTVFLQEGFEAANKQQGAKGSSTVTKQAAASCQTLESAVAAGELSLGKQYSYKGNKVTVADINGEYVALKPSGSRPLVTVIARDGVIEKTKGPRKENPPEHQPKTKKQNSNVKAHAGNTELHSNVGNMIDSDTLKKLKGMFG